MRKLVPLAALLLVGCSTGQMRRRPGSNVILPAAPSLTGELIKGLACLAVSADSARRTQGTAPGASTTKVSTGCEQSMSPQNAPLPAVRPPR